MILLSWTLQDIITLQVPCSVLCCHWGGSMRRAVWAVQNLPVGMTDVCSQRSTVVSHSMNERAKLACRAAGSYWCQELLSSSSMQMWPLFRLSEQPSLDAHGHSQTVTFIWWSSLFSFFLWSQILHASLHWVWSRIMNIYTFSFKWVNILSEILPGSFVLVMYLVL